MNGVKIIRITTVPVSLYKLLEGQPRFFSSRGMDYLCISSPGDDVKQLVMREKCRYEPVPMTRGITPFKDLKALWQMVRIIKREHPDIVHSHTPKAGIISMLAAKLSGVPHRLHTVAGLPLIEARGPKRKVLDLVEKLTYSCATKIYPNSKGLYNFILEHKFAKKDKLKIIGNGSSNGINTRYFSPDQVSEEQKSRLKQQVGIDPQDFIFVFVGRMVGDKGINELIAAFQSLIPNPKSETRNLKSGTWNLKLETWNLKPETQNPKPKTSIPKLLLVGPFESELDPLSLESLQAIESNPDIIHVDFQSDVRPYFAIADALVFPSYREGFPNVVMQAGAMELPSIVSNINGCNEIIIEGKNGIIIPPKDTEALCHAMKKMMSDKDYYNSLKENARRMIVERYEQRDVWEAILAEYRSLEEK